MTATAVAEGGPSIALATQRVTQRRVIRSEWTKLRSLRSTVFSLMAAAVLILGIGALVPAVVVAHWPPRNPADVASFDPTGVSLAGAFIAQLAIGVLGVLLITGEYATGMIRATLAAVPQRLPVLWAKLGVYAAVTLALMLPVVFAAFFIGQSLLSSKHIQASLSQPGVLRTVFGAALYLTVIGILGMALGALLRNTAAGIATLFGMLFVLPLIVHFLPTSWSDPINKFLPGNAGAAIAQVHPDSAGLSPWVGFAVFCGYAAVAIAAAAYMLKRRDA